MVSTSYNDSKSIAVSHNHLSIQNTGQPCVTGGNSYPPWAPALGTWQNYYHPLRRPTLDSITEAFFSMSNYQMTSLLINIFLASLLINNFPPCAVPKLLLRLPNVQQLHLYACILSSNNPPLLFVREENERERRGKGGGWIVF